MRRRKLSLGAGLIAILLLSPSAFATGSGSSTGSGTVDGGRAAGGVAMDVSIGWNDSSGLQCSVVGDTLEVRTAPKSPSDPADCRIKFIVYLAGGKTQSSFKYKLSVTVVNGVCTLVRWQTGKDQQTGTQSSAVVVTNESDDGITPRGSGGSGNEPFYEGVVITTGPNDKIIPIGASSIEPSPIPALGEWAMGFLAIGVMLAGIWMIRRRGVRQGPA